MPTLILQIVATVAVVLSGLLLAFIVSFLSGLQAGYGRAFGYSSRESQWPYWLIALIGGAVIAAIWRAF